MPEIEAHIVPEHQTEAFKRWFVETELLFKISDELRVEALRTAIFGVDGAAIHATLAEVAATAGKAV